MKKGFVLLLVSLFLIPYLGSSYASDRKKKKKAPIEQKNVTPKKPISKYEKLFKGKQHQAFPGKFSHDSPGWRQNLSGVPVKIHGTRSVNRPNTICHE